MFIRGWIILVAGSPRCAVPQICKFVICVASQRANAWDRSDTLPNIIRRYGAIRQSENLRYEARYTASRRQNLGIISLPFLFFLS